MYGLHILDIIMIILYFIVVIGIGYLANRRIKSEEDYFVGGRKFGKLVSIFLSFGVGTSSDTAISASRETFRMGMSGIWVQLLWLFATPFYWIIAPWYRRLRIVTGGDYFQERFHSRTLTALYVGFGLLWLMFYIAIGMTAIGKTVEVVTDATVTAQITVPVIALIVIIYGVLGGLCAAAWTDTLQGMLILILSIILLPAGLSKVNWFSGLHSQLPDSTFQIIGSAANSEYTWYYIIALIVMNLVGVAAQPHIFATGGGGAKDEMTARMGLVFGNFLKRFTTIMWGFTGVVALALYSHEVTDPDMIWGYATRQLLGPGFVGIMIACLLAAAMSSADAFMICGSALFTRNLYEPLISNRSEKHYILVARIVSSGSHCLNQHGRRWCSIKPLFQQYIRFN
jgi:SSS family solute:Na+ symporter